MSAILEDEEEEDKDDDTDGQFTAPSTKLESMKMNNYVQPSSHASDKSSFLLTGTVFSMTELRIYVRYASVLIKVIEPLSNAALQKELYAMTGF